LFVAHSFPYPPDEGIKLMSYHLIKTFSREHQVSLLSFIDKAETGYIEKIKPFCAAMELVSHQIPRSAAARLKNLLFSRRPFFVDQFYSTEFAGKLQKLVREQKPDIIHFDFIDTVMYIDNLGFTGTDAVIPSVFFPHDAFSMYLRGNVKGETQVVRKLYTWLQYVRTVRYEKLMLPKFTRTVVVSPKDKEWLHEKVSKDIVIDVIPNGVDYEYYSPMNLPKEYPAVIFRGIMDFLPNVDAAIHFCNDILPLVKQQVPEIKCFIVGKNPTSAIKRLHDNKTVFVTGYVEDIRPYIARSDINVCPMRIGSGIKNKILESMAMSVPTVATTKACYGIDVVDGENILVADTPEQFAGKVVMLLRDNRLRESIAQKSREFVLKNYTWLQSAQKFIKVYTTILEDWKISDNFRIGV
jgi:sugar transferase (PEP-CTERM/EpsH1 system associated)